MEIKNDDLKLDLVEKNIFLKAGIEENVFEKSIRYKIKDGIKDKRDNLPSGIYDVTAKLYSGDGSLQDTKKARLKISECNGNLKKSDR